MVKLSPCLLDLYTFCIHYTALLFERLSRRFDENKHEQVPYKEGSILMHTALNCNLNISGLLLMSNLKVIDFSQTSFASIRLSSFL